MQSLIQNFLVRNFILANPKAASVEDTTIPMVEQMLIRKEFLKNAVKVSRPTPFHPWA